MGDTKRQHYVPRCYLKRFSFDGKRLHTFLINQTCSPCLYEDDIHKVWKDISISDVCISNDYYTLKSQTLKCGMSSLALEKNFFQDYAEPKLNNIINTFDKLAQDILKGKTDIASIQVTAEQRLSLIQAAFIQHFRSPRSRRPFVEIGSVINHIYELRQKERGLHIDNFSELDVSYTHASKTYANPSLFRSFATKVSDYSMLIRVSDNGNFFTSDNPVVVHKLGAKGKDILQINILRDEFSLFFPLTPYIILELYNPSSFPEAISMNNTISIVHKDYEDQVNRYQYINAEKFIFSYKDDFSLFLKTDKPSHGTPEDADGGYGR